MDSLNVGAMREAAACLTGRHDFAAFQNQGTEISNTVRTLSSLTCREWNPLLIPSPAQTTVFSLEKETGGMPGLIWEFTADGFLKQMARNLMGLLVAVGLGKIAPAEVRAILKQGERPGHIPTAPARGLTLLRVYYPGDIW